MLSTRKQVLDLLQAGQSQAEIGRALGIAKSTVAYHCRRVREPDTRFSRRYNWKAVQSYYDEGHTVRECAAHFGFSTYSWHAAKKRGAIVTRPREMPIDLLLAGPRRDRGHIKSRLLKAELLRAQCQLCGLADWRGRPLSLELHHVNGNGRDNRLENLALLCPNCHSQTASWGGRNSARVVRMRAVNSARSRDTTATPPPANPPERTGR